MELTKSQIKTIQDIYTSKELPDKFPSEEEWEFMYAIAESLTLDDYLKMPLQEQQKWWIELDPMALPQKTGRFTNKGEALYEYNFEFEPAHPSILERDY